MIYIVLFFVFASFAILDLIEDVNTLKVFLFIFSIIVCIILSSIRWNTGPDWVSYFDFYRDIRLYTKGHLASVNLMEPGYTKLNLWINELGFNYTGFLTILAVFTIGLKAKVFFHHKNIMMITLFLYYCYYLADITFVRQFTAVSITLFSVLFIFKKKPVIFYALVLLACTIHISSILFLLAYWIYYRPIRPKRLIIFLVVALILGMVNVGDYAVKGVLGLVSHGSDIAEKLLAYQTQGLKSVPHPYRGFVLGIFKRAVVLPLFFWGINHIEDQYKERYTGYLNLLVFGNIIYFMFALSIPVIQRLSVPFLIFEIFLWGYLIVSLRDLKLRFSMYALLVLFGALRLYSFMAPYKDLYFPFKTIFG